MPAQQRHRAVTLAELRRARGASAGIARASRSMRSLTAPALGSAWQGPRLAARGRVLRRPPPRPRPLPRLENQPTPLAGSVAATFAELGLTPPADEPRLALALPAWHPPPISVEARLLARGHPTRAAHERAPTPSLPGVNPQSRATPRPTPPGRPVAKIRAALAVARRRLHALTEQLTQLIQLWPAQPTPALTSARTTPKAAPGAPQYARPAAAPAGEEGFTRIIAKRFDGFSPTETRTEPEIPRELVAAQNASIDLEPSSPAPGPERVSPSPAAEPEAAPAKASPPRADPAALHPFIHIVAARLGGAVPTASTRDVRERAVARAIARSRDERLAQIQQAPETISVIAQRLNCEIDTLQRTLWGEYPNGVPIPPPSRASTNAEAIAREHRIWATLMHWTKTALPDLEAWIIKTQTQRARAGRGDRQAQAPSTPAPTPTPGRPAPRTASSAPQGADAGATPARVEELTRIVAKRILGVVPTDAESIERERRIAQALAQTKDPRLGRARARAEVRGDFAAELNVTIDLMQMELWGGTPREPRTAPRERTTQQDEAAAQALVRWQSIEFPKLLASLKRMGRATGPKPETPVPRPDPAAALHPFIQIAAARLGGATSTAPTRDAREDAVAAAIAQLRDNRLARIQQVPESIPYVAQRLNREIDALQRELWGQYPTGAPKPPHRATTNAGAKARETLTWATLMRWATTVLPDLEAWIARVPNRQAVEQQTKAPEPGRGPNQGLGI